MSKIIIGVHGLGNKPPKEILERWWREAILEGLKANSHPRPFLKFKLVYWADVIYDDSLDLKEKDKNAPLFIDDPYVPSKKIKKKVPSGLSSKLFAYLEKQMEKVYLNKDLSINYTSITDLFIRHFFRDLDIYYYKSCLKKGRSEIPVKDVIRERLSEALRDYQRNNILLIAHSMGSIIAFDVLIGAMSQIKIDTLVTIGSPLGLPAVMVKILAEQQIDYKNELKIKTPENIKRHWHNFFDPDDRVALNRSLADDYMENALHVRPMDESVHNDYEYNGKFNPHQAYGYLRTPQLAQLVTDFLNRGRPRLWIRLSEVFNKRIQRMLDRKKNRY